MISIAAMPARRLVSLIDTECSVKPPAVVQYEKRAVSTVQFGCRFDGETVDHRLKLLAAADDRAAFRSIFGCFVIGDAKNGGNAGS